jgi:hypothetical protein
MDGVLGEKIAQSGFAQLTDVKCLRLRNRWGIGMMTERRLKEIGQQRWEGAQRPCFSSVNVSLKAP